MTTTRRPEWEDERPWVRNALAALETRVERTEAEVLRAYERSRKELFAQWSSMDQESLHFSRIAELLHQSEEAIAALVVKNNAILGAALSATTTIESNAALDDIRRMVPRPTRDDSLLHTGPRIPDDVVRVMATNAAANVRAVGDELRLSIRRELTQSTIMGESPYQAARRILANPADSERLSLEGIRPVFKSVRERAIVIARTEIVNAANTAHQAVYEDAEEEFDDLEMKWSSALEPSRTCPICKGLHGQHRKPSTIEQNPFLIVIGTKTYRFVRPAAHPRCLCRLVAWFPNEAERLEAHKNNPKPKKVEEPTVVTATNEPRVFETPQEAEAWAKDAFAKPMEKLSDAEKKEIISYSDGTSYGNVNRRLRGLEMPEPAKVRTDARLPLLDAAIDKVEVPEAVRVYRGFNMPADMELKVGETFTEQGYMSTSFSEKVAKLYAGNVEGGVMLELDVPAGVKGLYTPVLDPGEYQLMLQRDSKFKVLSITEEGGIKRVRAEIVQEAKVEVPVPAPKPAKVAPRSYDRLSGKKNLDTWAYKNLPTADELSHEQVEALRWYQKNGYKAINGHLRTGSVGKKPWWFEGTQEELEATAVESTKHIDAAMQPLKQALVVHRIVEGDFAVELAKNVGSIVQDLGYVSTSPLKAGVDNFAEMGIVAPKFKQAVIEMRIPEGTKAFYVDALSSKKEYELLLERGLQFKVTYAHKAANGVRHIIMEVVE